MGWLSEEAYAALLARGNIREISSSKPPPHVAGNSPAKREGVPQDIPEDVFMERVRTRALGLGWLFYHPYSSKRSTPGWPDVALCHPDGGPLYLLELKSATGALSPAQRRWLEALERVTRVECGVYRPADWDKIQQMIVS